MSNSFKARLVGSLLALAIWVMVYLTALVLTPNELRPWALSEVVGLPGVTLAAIAHRVGSPYEAGDVRLAIQAVLSAPFVWTGIVWIMVTILSLPLENRQPFREWLRRFWFGLATVYLLSAVIYTQVRLPVIYHTKSGIVVVRGSGPEGGGLRWRQS